MLSPSRCSRVRLIDRACGPFPSRFCHLPARPFVRRAFWTLWTFGTLWAAGLPRSPDLRRVLRVAGGPCGAAAGDRVVHGAAGRGGLLRVRPVPARRAAGHSRDELQPRQRGAPRLRRDPRAPHPVPGARPHRKDPELGAQRAGPRREAAQRARQLLPNPLRHLRHAHRLRPPAPRRRALPARSACFRGEWDPTNFDP